MKNQKHPVKKWVVSISEYKENEETLLIPELSVSETKVLDSKEDAKKQFEEWLK